MQVPGGKLPLNAGAKRRLGGNAPRTKPGKVLERWLAISIGVVSITGAALTFLAIQEEGRAGGLDRQAVAETVLVQQWRIDAQVAVRTQGALAAEYRRMLAGADAVIGIHPQQGEDLRLYAGLLRSQAQIPPHLLGTQATDRFDYARSRQSWLHKGDPFVVPATQPDLTSISADDHHSKARELAGVVVGLLAVIVILTMARLARTKRRRGAIAGVACAVYLGLLLFAGSW